MTGAGDIEARRAERAGAQVRAVAEGVGAPHALRAAVAAQRLRRPPTRRRVDPRALAATAAALIAALALAAGLLVGRPSPAAAPTVTGAAALALHAPDDPAPMPAGDGRLRASVGGVTFPDYGQGGWRPVGSRTGRIGGRAAIAVTYSHGRGALGYAIVDGPPLPWPVEAERVVYEGVPVALVRRGDAVVVTWRRGGHTCVVAARGLPVERLLDVATAA